jgi:3-oxoacyl-[acyl-carrier-protein] synthase-3
VDQRLHYIKMNGREVYRFATRVMGRAAKQACEKAGVALHEIDLFIPHQANIRIIDSATKYLKISEEKVFTNLDKYGNTSAASIPLALCEAIEAGRVHTKDKLVMVGFGGGLSWGATVVQWGVPMPHKQRGWWYKALRWSVYRWARVRSATIRLSRWLESLLPVEEANTPYTPPVPEKQKEEVSQPHRNNGNGVKPPSIDLPSELPLIKPAEIEEKVLEVERPLNGK